MEKGGGGGDERERNMGGRVSREMVVVTLMQSLVPHNLDESGGIPKEENRSFGQQSCEVCIKVIRLFCLKCFRKNAV